jgi:hypothetical protein
MHIGQCKLCLRKRELRDSHYLPAAILRQLRSKGEQNPNPIFVTKDSTIQTSRPMKEYLLCHECEDRFSKNGETWVIGHMARRDKFPIFDTLAAVQPAYSFNRLDYFEGRNIEGIAVDKLVYFGLSVFWRGSIHRWRTQSGPLERIELGPFREPIRRFLLDGSGLPTNLAIIIGIWPDRNPFMGAYTPAKGRVEGYHRFAFYIPGIEFRLAAGRMIPKQMRSACAYRSPQGLIFRSESVRVNTLQAFTRLNRMRNEQQKMKR